MERARNIRNRSHAPRPGLAAAWILQAGVALCCGNAWAEAVPFSPAPHIGEKGDARFGLIANHFPTDPVNGEPKERSPWVIDFHAVPFERFAIEAAGGDGGAGFGMIMALYEQDDVGLDVSAGFDELFFASQSHLFGLTSETLPSRIWIGASRKWKWARLGTSIAVEPETEGVEYVPYGSVEAFLPFGTTLGYETSYLKDIWRHHVGVSLAWSPCVIGFGLSEVQSWMVRNGEFGMNNVARPGSSTGLDNPGWWFSLSFELPRFEKPPAPLVRTVVEGPVHLDSADLVRLDRLAAERAVRSDLAELAMRFSAEGVDPMETGALRRRILSGGAQARAILLRIALDTSVTLAERTQAVSIAVSRPVEADLPALEGLTEDPSPELRIETALALKKLGGSRAKTLLERLQRDPDEIVRAAASKSD